MSAHALNAPRIMKRLLIIIILFLISGCDFFERHDSHFNDYAELTNSQSWKGGWAPKLIPKDSINIHESHDIDTNSVIFSFDFSGNFKDQLDKICGKKTGYDDIQFANINAKWWPNSLTGDGFASSHEYHYYSCPDAEGYFAIPFSSKTAYFWRL
jgi:hypothetical protein